MGQSYARHLEAAAGLVDAVHLTLGQATPLLQANFPRANSGPQGLLTNEFDSKRVFISR